MDLGNTEDNNSESADQFNDAFAFLSFDIVADLLACHVTTFNEAASLASIDSSWGDLVRSGRFELCDFDNENTDCEVNFSLCGMKREDLIEVEDLVKSNPDWLSLNLTFKNVSLNFNSRSCSDASTVLKILRSSTGKVTLKNTDWFLRNSVSSFEDLFSALGNSRATDVKVEFSRNPYWIKLESLSADLQPLLSNPYLQSLELKDAVRDINQIVDFCLNVETDKKLTFFAKTADYDQFTDVLGERVFRTLHLACKCFLFECTCGHDEECRTDDCTIDYSMFQKLHPKDNTKVIRQFTQHVEGCSTGRFGDFAKVNLIALGIDVVGSAAERKLTDAFEREKNKLKNQISGRVRGSLWPF